MVGEFCNARERDMQDKIDSQRGVINQLQDQIVTDKQTILFNSAFKALDDKIDAIAAKQPNTIPVQWPNITAVNTTPYMGYGWGNWGSNSFWN